jgi:hypothetical protein
MAIDRETLRLVTVSAIAAAILALIASIVIYRLNVPTTVLVLRHAEKEGPPADPVDPPLSVAGGYTNTAVRDISVPLADTIASWAGTLGALAPAQIYRGTNGGSGSDRNVFDGAINRSDHAAFHEQGYPAVVVSEDFFVNLASEPGADPNPNYHDEDDLVIDSAYAADITCAVAHAVRESAGG